MAQRNRRGKSEPLVRIVGYGTRHPTTMVELSYAGRVVDVSGSFLGIDHNPMGAGSSGSPWINDRGEVVSLSSHYFNHGVGHKHGDDVVIHGHDHMHGPLFDNDTFAMLDYVESGCD